VRRHLERHGLLGHLDLQVFSDEVGYSEARPARVPRGRSIHSASRPTEHCTSAICDAPT
jgi:hypothetical protein